MNILLTLAPLAGFGHKACFKALSKLAIAPAVPEAAILLPNTLNSSTFVAAYNYIC